MSKISSMSDPIFDFSGLSVEQRLQLIGQLWDSLDHASVPLDPKQAAELDRRMAAFEADGDPGEPADIALQHIRKSLE